MSVFNTLPLPLDARAALEDPSISQWLKIQIIQLLDRDPVDAVNDVKMLLGFAEARLAEAPENEAQIK